MANPNFDICIEGIEPVVNANGFNTNKNITSTGTNSWTGTQTFSGGRVGTVNASSGNTAPAANQSGQTFLFDSATGITYTLPTPVSGAEYNFVIMNTVTSGNHKIITSSGSVFLLGVVVEGSTNGAPIMAVGNGTTHVAVTMNGTTTGGVLGTSLNFKCVSSTIWEVTGSIITSGTPSTPFATS